MVDEAVAYGYGYVLIALVRTSTKTGNPRSRKLGIRSSLSYCSLANLRVMSPLNTCCSREKEPARGDDGLVICRTPFDYALPNVPLGRRCPE